MLLRAVVQRVKKASISVNNEIVNKIDYGLLVFLGVEDGDNEKDLDYLVNKITGLRIFEDQDEKMNLSLLDVSGDLLVISQFTLLGDARKGRRPSFPNAAPPEMGEKLYKEFIRKCKLKNIETKEGVFGAHMKVDLINDGPVTILLDSKRNF